ncbi:MAG: hypothetical protein ABJG88_01500 [Litorimonas sp.]
MADLVDASISFKPNGFSNDYHINDKPLREIIFNDTENASQNQYGLKVGVDYLTSIESGPKTTTKRLIGDEEPDLIHGLTALYLCGHCGGYDGTLIGAHINIYNDHIVWSNIGYSSDIIELYPKHKPFEHLPAFSFKRDNYEKFIEDARTFEIK